MRWIKHPVNPYWERKYRHFKMRKFEAGCDPGRLVWHWDETDRVLVPLTATDWTFQHEWQDEPQPIAGPIAVQAGSYHRLVPGSGELVVIIVELPEGTVDSSDPA